MWSMPKCPMVIAHWSCEIEKTNNPLRREMVARPGVRHLRHPWGTVEFFVPTVLSLFCGEITKWFCGDTHGLRYTI